MADAGTVSRSANRLSDLASRSSEGIRGELVGALESGSANLEAALGDIIAKNAGSRQAILDVLAVDAPASFDWSAIRGDATGLAFLYNFAPFQDTGSTVASKRLRDFGKTVDVISCSMLQHKKIDLTVEKIALPYISRRQFLPLAPSWASWDSFQGFAVQANKKADEWIRNGSQYEFVYSRAMWAPSIYAAALFKRRHPQVRWVAEFSDPLSRDAQGEVRDAPAARSGIFGTLVGGVPDLESIYERDAPGVFSLAENLAYALADEIVFTNANQREVMLAAIQSEELRTRAWAISRVSNHPTLPPVYYDAAVCADYVEPDRLNIAYFGEFYASRGISEVLRAADALPEDLADKLRLHVFTNYAPGRTSAGTANFSPARRKELEDMAFTGVGAEPGDPRVVFHESLPYLEFLAAMKQFDALVLSDAESGQGHALNPYLPSKWSDYAGSSTPVWALVEPESVLSTKPASHRTTRGSVEQATAVLRSLISAKFEETGA